MPPSRFIQLVFDQAVKEIEKVYKPESKAWIVEHEKGLWIQILDLEDRINKAMIENRDAEAEKLIEEWLKKWKTGLARQRSLFK